MWEGGKPYALDPQTLETIGEDDLGGALAGNANFAAHPHYDRRTGEMVNFGIQPGLSSTIALYTLDADLNVTAQYRWEVPGFAFIHDFALTDDYAVFFQNPVTVNPLPYWFGFRAQPNVSSFSLTARRKSICFRAVADGCAPTKPTPALCFTTSMPTLQMTC